MAWVKFDDQFNMHPKVAQAGALASALYMRSVVYSGQYLTDGFIPYGVVGSLIDWDLDGVREIPGSDHPNKKDRCCNVEPVPVDNYHLADRLVNCGLWEECERGWRIHDYLDWNPSKVEVLALREKRSSAGRAGGQARAKANAKAKQQAKNKQNSTPSPSPSPRDEIKGGLEKFQSALSDAGICLAMSATEREVFSRLAPVRDDEIADALARVGGRKVSRASYILKIIESTREELAELKSQPKPPPAQDKPMEMPRGQSWVPPYLRLEPE